MLAFYPSLSVYSWSPFRFLWSRSGYSCVQVVCRSDGGIRKARDRLRDRERQKMSERQKEHSCFERQKKLACVSVYSLFPKVAPWKRVLRVFGVWNNTKPLEDEILSTLFVSMQPSPHVVNVLSFFSPLNNCQTSLFLFEHSWRLYCPDS